MNQDSIKLTQLRAMVAVAESGNFSEAGLHLGVSQSAVSHAIATLEEELGVILFSRGRYGAHITPVGERMLHHARQMLNLLDAMDKEAALAKGLQGGQVGITSIRSVAPHVLPEVIAQFRDRYPGISVALTEYRGDDSIEQALREGRADIGFTCLPTASEFETLELFRDEYIALLPPDAKLNHLPLTWEELATYPMIMPAANDYCSLIIDNHLTQLNQSISPAYRITEDSTIVGMVMRGLGATIIARLAAEPLPADVQIHDLPVPLVRTIRVITLRDALHPPSVYAFLDTLKGSFSYGNVAEGLRIKV